MNHNHRDPATRVPRRAAVLAISALLVATAIAVAGAFTAGGLYTGRGCRTTGVKGATCVYRFRANRSGTALRFIGSTVTTSWACRGGGGEALLGGKLRYAEPIPVITARSNGSLTGSAGAGQKKIAVTGHLANGGSGAVIYFHLINQHCVTPRVTLTKH